MSVLYALVILPMIILSLLIFVFQSSLTKIEEKQFLMNCPLPIYEGVARNITQETGSVIISYDIEHKLDINNNSTADPEEMVGTRFECISYVNGVGAFTTSTFEYGSAEGFTSFPYGWFGWAGHTVSDIFDRAGHALGIGWLNFNAPAEVTQIPAFTYINVVLVGWFGMGLFIMFRGGS